MSTQQKEKLGLQTSILWNIPCDAASCWQVGVKNLEIEDNWRTGIVEEEYEGEIEEEGDICD